MRVPIAERSRIALDPQCPHLARRYLLPFCIDDFGFIAFDYPTQRSGLNIARPIGDVDVEHFGRTNAITNFHVEDFLPTMIKLCGQSLARRIAKANTRYVSNARV